MKTLTNRKWLMTVCGLVIVAIVLCSVITYAVDPFFQYRVKDNQYILNARYSSPGLIKNYSYDTIIIGSSMMQNFNMDLFRTTLDCSPVHIGFGGITDEEIAEYILLANDTGKAKDYYICIDLAHFRSRQESTNIDYLMNDNPLSHLQYALSYEASFKYLPLDVVFSALKKSGYSFPKVYDNKMSIDKLGYWGNQYKYGEDIVLNGAKAGIASVSTVDTTDLYTKMIDGMDSFFSQLDLSNADYNFFFPPYSSLFWSNAQHEGYFDIYLDAKDYFINKAAEYGATVYDFQSEDFTTDLDNYKDTTHYKPAINDWMTECFSTKEHTVNSENCSEYRNQLIENTDKFNNEHDDLYE